MPRFSVGTEFFVTCGDEDEARTIVGNFVDGFPEHCDDDAEGDAILQDASEVPE